MQFQLSGATLQRRTTAAVALALLAAPVLPATALAATTEGVNGLETAAQIVASTPVEAASDEIELTASEVEPRYDYQLYYLDGLGDTWYNDADVMRYLYVRTNNPEADFDFEFAQSTGDVVESLQPNEFDDVDDQGQSYSCLRVEGGFITGLCFGTDATGPQTIELYEITRDSNYHETSRVLAATFTVNFASYFDAADQWADDVIARYTDSSMDPLEKMQAVCDGLLDEFDYIWTDDGLLVTLVTKPVAPFFKTKHWQSQTSPDALCLIAEHIGGFSDIHDCYGDYPMGSPEWQSTHFYCRVTYNGEDHLFMACPPVDSGDIDLDQVGKVDFNNTDSSVFDEPLNYKEVGSQDEQPTEHKVSELSPNGSVTISSGATATSGEVVTVTLTPDEGFVVDGLEVRKADGSAVTATPAGENTWTFVMPPSDVTVFAKFLKAGDSWSCDGGAGCPSHRFADIDVNMWYHQSVDWAVENGVMSGYTGTGLFGPADTISRAEMAQVLYNIAGKPSVDSSIADRYVDCTPGAWYSDAVSWAVGEGIFSGYDGGAFGPGDPITREQIAVVLWRQAGEPAGTGDLSVFPDGASTSAWASEAMRWAVGEGIFSGNSATGALSPTGNLTRAEAATVMMRYLA